MSKFNAVKNENRIQELLYMKPVTIQNLIEKDCDQCDFNSIVSVVITVILVSVVITVILVSVVITVILVSVVITVI